MTNASREEAETLSPLALRHEIRAGRFSEGTAGQAYGYVQANLVVLPLEWARDFARFCLKNPVPCPIIGVSDPGNPAIPELGADLDIRTDIPRYCLYENGAFAQELTDLTAHWQDDFVAFAIGCSYTFERALIADGIHLRHIDEEKVVPMFRTNIRTMPAGPFSGNMVVSMRPLQPDQVSRTVEITEAFPYAHGGPVHLGRPEEIGIADASVPDYGESVSLKDGEVTGFWACGVTPQAIIENARPPICIAHKPGHMLVTDLEDGPAAMRAWDAARRKLQQTGSL